MLAAQDDGGGGSRALGGLGLLAQIDQLFGGLVDIIAGTGSKSRSARNNSLMSPAASKGCLARIDSPQGWTFAFEGGAHILFKHMAGQDHRFVPFPRSPDRKGYFY
jgi:hypothetical protein